MNKPLKLQDIKDFTQEAETAYSHPECATCECYLGYLAQLQIDADPDGQAFLKEHQPARDQVHSCLGCDPCPPGILFSNYLRKKTEKDKEHLNERS